MSGLVGLVLQTFFPAKPRFTEKEVPDSTGKVVIVTGSNTGVGKEIAQILYSKNAKVYMMARSEDKTKQAIKDIKAAFPSSAGEMHFIRLDLSDMTTIKASVDQFRSREDKLHLLFNNAGVAFPEKGSKTKQGYELQLGVNCVGPFGLTKLLAPTLAAAAAASAPGAVRVVWVASSAAEQPSPRGVVERLAAVSAGQDSFAQYSTSKLGNYLHATEFAARHRGDGVVSVSLNPGNLDSDLWRTQGRFAHWLMRKTVLYPTVYGAYTCLFAALSPEITLENSGTYVAPWGQTWNRLSKDMLKAAKPVAEGGTGVASQFWEWCEEQWKPYW